MAVSEDESVARDNKPGPAALAALAIQNPDVDDRRRHAVYDRSDGLGIGIEQLIVPLFWGDRRAATEVSAGGAQDRGNESRWISGHR